MNKTTNEIIVAVWIVVFLVGLCSLIMWEPTPEKKPKPTPGYRYPIASNPGNPSELTRLGRDPNRARTYADLADKECVKICSANLFRELRYNGKLDLCIGITHKKQLYECVKTAAGARMRGCYEKCM